MSEELYPVFKHVLPSSMKVEDVALVNGDDEMGIGLTVKTQPKSVVETHDEGTLMRVKASLMELGFSAESSEETIGHLMSSGFVIREFHRG